MPNSLEQEFEWYLKNQSELVKKYEGKIIVIKNCEIIGDYDDIGVAVDETSKKHERGTFLVQKCTSGNQDYSATFHSRVA